MTTIKERSTDFTQDKSSAFFKDLKLFANLRSTELAHFSRAAQIKNYKKGQFLYIEGEQAEFFYIVCSGWLKLCNTTEEGEEVILAMLTKDSVTGESAMFEHGRYTSSAQIAEDSQILSVPLSILQGQLRVNNQLALNMLASMVQYQRRHELQLEQYLLYSAPQRIGCFLLGLLPASEHKDGATLDLPYDKGLIASTLGMKGATFSRALHILRDETGINIAGARVKIDSMQRLLKFVNGCYSQTHLRG